MFLPLQSKPLGAAVAARSCVLTAACLVFSFAGLSCSNGTTTQVMVFITAEPVLAAQASHIRIRLDGDPRDTGELAGRDLSPAANPWRVPLVPADDDSSLKYTLTAELWSGDPEDEGSTLITEKGVRSGFVEGEFREVWITMDYDCTVACPDGFRCFEGQCMEHCVEPTEPGATTDSVPIACDEPCTTGGCEDLDEPLNNNIAHVVSCDQGVRVFEDGCGLGCNAGADACGRLTPSNIGAVTSSMPLSDVVLSTDTLFRTNAGVAVTDDLAGDEIEGVHFEESTVPAATCFGGDPFENYGVFFVKSLHIEAGVQVRATGTRPLIIVADGDVIIDGELQLSSAASLGSGAASCRGGILPPSAADRAGIGIGGGQGAISAGDSWSGAGGGSFGGLGGSGGDGTEGNDGAAAGLVHGDGGGEDEADLVPLFGGSGGGAGGGGAGGAGGGAIQITTTGRIVIGTTGRVWAGGSGGGAAPDNTSGGAGGSGGAILLEAKELVCPVDSPDYAIGAPGGGGASFFNGASARTTDIPAPGAPGVPGEGIPPGGNGSDVLGDAAPGGPGQFAGAGGGGAGRIRINTLDGDADTEIPCGLQLQPISFGPLLIE